MWSSSRLPRILRAITCKIQISFPQKNIHFSFSCDKFRSRLGSIKLPSWMNCIRQVFDIFVDSVCILMFWFSFLPKNSQKCNWTGFFINFFTFTLPFILSQVWWTPLWQIRVTLHAKHLLFREASATGKTTHRWRRLDGGLRWKFYIQQNRQWIYNGKYILHWDYSRPF